jgi:putative transposase
MVRLSKSQYYYKSRQDDSAVIEALITIANQHPSYGFRKLYAYIRRSGKTWNHKRVYRVYKLLNLNKKRRTKRRIPARIKQPLQQQPDINMSWSMDFMSDSLVDGRKYRTLNIIDDYNREALAIEIDTSISAGRVVRTLEQIISWRGKPRVIRMDNGPEYTSKDLEIWAVAEGVSLQHIQPGKPMQNGYIERFNGSYRREILDAYVFDSLDEVRLITEEWIEEYNNRRPHESLQDHTPNEWKNKLLKAKSSTFELSE